MSRVGAGEPALAVSIKPQYRPPACTLKKKKKARAYNTTTGETRQVGPESLLARKPSFWLSKQAIEEHVLLRHTASVARACTLKSTHHTRSYISCMISKFKKNPSNSVKSCVAICPKCTFQAMSESGEDDVCDVIPWEWALVWPPPVPLFCCFPTWRGKWALQNSSLRLSPSLSGRTEPRATQSGLC